MRCLAHLRQAKQLRKDTQITGTRFDPRSGIAVGESVQIPWRIAQFMANCLLRKADAELEYLRTDLTRVVMGTLPAQNGIRHPFLNAQGIVR